MLYNTLVSLIRKKRTNNLREKIDIFFAADRITEEQYNALVEMLSKEA